MRSCRALVLSTAVFALGGCSSSFDAGSQGPPGDDAGDENPGIQAIGGDSGQDGTTGSDAGHHDAAAGQDGAGDAIATDDTGGAEAAPGCPGGQLDCSGTCVPNDVHNCGTCGHDCTNLPHVAGTTTCSASGACTFTAQDCAPGWADCNGNPDDGCEQDITGPQHCGSCTNVCPTGDPVCSSGTCVSGCGTQTLCSGSCVDTTSNANDCNGCGNACPNTVANSQPVCVSSACTFTCNGGFSGCPAASPTSCVDEQHDANNCGSCGHTCPNPTSGAGQPACAGGSCTLDCSAGLTACPTAAPTECANTTDDTSNCGSCGNACTTAVANAFPTCAGSTCGFACDNGFLECNGNSCIPQADTTNGAFVSPSGSGTACTATQPCTTIAAAIATGKGIIYLDKGTYTEVVSLPAATLTIHGGWSFSANGWTNCDGTSATSIISAPAATGSTVIDSASGTWTLDMLTIQNETTAVAGQSLYGVLLGAGGLTLTNVSIEVAPGGAGVTGMTGAGGAAPPASCTASSISDAGAIGTNGTSGPLGAVGQQGTYGATGFVAKSGGQNPATGQQGGSGAATPPNTHVTCGLATDGDGCGSSTATSGDGNPGCGSYGGGGGYGGTGGGSSIGAFAGGSSSITFSGVTIQTGAGGKGGQGGAGGTGAAGSLGTVGTQGEYRSGCANTPTGCKPGGSPPCGCSLGTAGFFPGGAAGTQGGTGGSGGGGGGGAGGDSLCYATPAGGPPNGTVTCTPGTAGVGGLDGNGTTASQGVTGRSGPNN